MSAIQINMYLNISHAAKCLCICQQFAGYNSRDNPACCLQSVSQEGIVMASLLYYQNKAQPAPGHRKPHSEKTYREEFPGINLFSLLPDILPDDACGEGFTKTWRVRLISSTPSAVTGVVDSLLPGTSGHQHLPTREPGEFRDDPCRLRQQPCPWSPQGGRVSWLGAQEPGGFLIWHHQRHSSCSLPLPQSPPTREEGGPGNSTWSVCRGPQDGFYKL